MNSKAGIGLSTESLVGLIFAVIAILIAVGVFYAIYALFIQTGIDQGTIAKFNEMGTNLEDLFNRTEQEKAGYFITPLYIKQNAGIIVFFNSNCGFTKGDANCPISNCHTTDSDYHIPKPSRAGKTRGCEEKQACMCLFKEHSGGDFDGEENMPEMCRSFAASKNIFFISPAQGTLDFDPKDWITGVKFTGAEGFQVVNSYDLYATPETPWKAFEYPVIYGECGSPLGVQKMYVEYTEQGNSGFVFIAPNKMDEEKSVVSLRDEIIYKAAVCSSDKKYEAGRCVLKS